MQNISQLPPENQLDFWLGDWDAHWGEGQRGSNRIQRAFAGRVIQEDFDGRPAQKFQGRSVSVYSPQIQQWQQTWVDTEGSYWHLRGGWQTDRFILVADDVREGRAIKYRMVFHTITYEAFVWDWELSEDDGQTWALRWQIHYHRRNGSAA